MTNAILTWYSGKSLDNAKYALELLAQSEAAGQWIPHASRKVRALLSKQNVAAKLSKAIAVPPILTYAVLEMRYGCFVRAPQVLAKLPEADGGDTEALAMIRRWATSCAPVAELVALLDSRRPRPVVVCKTLSLSVVANLAGKLGLTLSSVEIPPSRGEWIDVTRPIKGDRYGRTETVKVWHVEILWPAGTRHQRSRFAQGSRAGNSQCEACGHAIRDPYNWLPLVAREADGKPSSLWVGRDCARKLLECEVDNGEAIYAGRAVRP